MTTIMKSAEERAAIKEQRTRDAELAMRDYQADRLAVLAKTERLRQLRLARDSQRVAVPGVKKAARKTG